MEKFIKQNWFKVGVLIVGILVIIFLFNSQKSNRTETSITPNSNILDSTEKTQPQQKTVSDNTIVSKTQNQCTQKANVFLLSLKMPDYSVKSHYSEELNRCFFVVQNESNDDIVMRTLYSESGEILGTYNEILITGDATLCNALIPHKEPAKFGCTAGASDLSSNISYKDWQNFIKPYMEN